MTTPTQTGLDLQAAADELGVHYQTAYRWVRSGRLPARRVGGRYVVEPADLAAVDRDRTTPEEPPPPSRTRVAHSGRRMHSLLVDGDEAAARRLARRLVDEGTPVVELIQAVLVPALVDIGRGWSDGEISIWAEHRASAIVERILGDLTPNPRGRRRGIAVVAAIAGDRHSLPTTMAAVALRADHWHVHHLGADVPATEIVDFCAAHPVDVVVLTSTNPATHPDATAVAGRLAESATPVVVGRPGLTLDDLIAAARTARTGQEAH